MTIACCYVSPEGVVFGADSTASYSLGSGMRHYNHNQKIFQVGSSGTLAIMTWGLGSLTPLSYRTLFARLSDELGAQPPDSVATAMGKWIEIFWAAYTAALSTPEQKPLVDICRALSAKRPHVRGQVPLPGDMRSEKEEQQYQQLRNGLTVGFCVGGYTLPDRSPSAQFVHFDPLMAAAPIASEIPVMSYEFWGVPNIFQRLIRAADEETRQSLMASGKWTGTKQELDEVFQKHSLGHPAIPLRDVVDFVYSCIYSTIKAIKFSFFPPVCGGPIELAVISTDRDFRWVRHKMWDAAVADGAKP